MDASRRFLTAADLARQVAGHSGYPRGKVRGVIRDLIAQGVLEYHYTFGQSYIARSFRKPVRVGNAFVIVPPDYTGKLPRGCHALAIAPGAAFGCGRHPTTRLALEALEQGWGLLNPAANAAETAVLDVGTGSGILAIGAAILGAQSVLALDIDACARSEARQNIALNQMAERISVSGVALEAIENKFYLVIANLRTPTLVQLSGWICDHLQSPGGLIASGFREEEWERLCDVYTGKGLACRWHGATSGWAGGVFMPM